jgi:hypothetical protein
VLLICILVLALFECPLLSRAGEAVSGALETVPGNMVEYGSSGTAAEVGGDREVCGQLWKYTESATGVREGLEASGEGGVEGKRGEIIALYQERTSELILLGELSSDISKLIMHFAFLHMPHIAEPLKPLSSEETDP